MGTTELSVLIVSYRTRERTLRCLRSIFRETLSTRIEVVVVDNSSQDGTVEAVEAEFPSVVLVSLDRNLGFARAINLAAERSLGDYLVLLNPDTEVINRALDVLLGFARIHPRQGLYTGRTIRPDGVLDPRSCWGAPSLWSMTCFGFGLTTLFPSSSVFNPESLGPWRRDSVREVGVISGCLCLVSRRVWEELHGLDPVYFMYGEDVDLCVRAARLGYQPIFTPDATIVHVGSASFSSDTDKGRLLMRGKATFVRRRWRGLARYWALSMLALGVALRAVLFELGAGEAGKRVWSELWRSRKQWMAGYTTGSRGGDGDGEYE